MNFCGRTLTTNCRSLAVLCSLGCLSFRRMLVNNFLLNWTASSSAMYFSVSLGAYIVTIKMAKSTHSRLDVSDSLGPERPKRLDKNTSQMMKRSSPTEKSIGPTEKKYNQEVRQYFLAGDGADSKWPPVHEVKCIKNEAEVCKNLTYMYYIPFLF